MSDSTNRNLCMYCSAAISGRSDKKFCDSQCRSSYHHKNNGKENSLIRSINKKLKQNRKILALYSSKGEKVCNAYQLLYSGFDFSIHTSIKLRKNGKIAYFCYDHGYIAQDDDTLYLIKKTEDF